MDGSGSDYKRQKLLFLNTEIAKYKCSRKKKIAKYKR